MSRRLKLKSLHVFMAMILLIGLVQPGLAFAAESANTEEGNAEETLVGEVEESVEEEALEEEVEETTGEEAFVEEVEETAGEEALEEEMEEVAEEEALTNDIEVATEENAEDEASSEDQPETTEIEDDSEQETDSGDEESIQEVQKLEADVQPLLAQNIDNIVSEVYLDGKEEIDFSFEFHPDRISQWELARGGVEFWLDAPSGRDATLTVGGQSFEFETRYLHQDMLSVDLNPGTYDVEVTIGSTTETEQLVVVSDEKYYEDDPERDPRLESREMVLTKSEAEEIETIRVYGDDIPEHTSIDVLVNGERVQTFYHDWGSASAEIEVGHLPVGKYTIEFVHPTGSAEMTLTIVPDEQGAPAPAGTYEGTTIQYMGGSHMLDNPFELPIKFEVDEAGFIKNLEVEYWWVCMLADGQSGFSTSIEMPDTQITVNQAFQIDWEEGASPRSLVGIIHDDGTASGTFFSHSLGCGTSASDWNLISDIPPIPQPDPEPEEFEVGWEKDTTEETEGPVTIMVSTTSQSDITDLKWLTGDRTEDDFAQAGNEIDLETMSFLVTENGTYTIYALNADGVVSLSTITIENIVESDPVPDPDPQPEEFEIDLDPDTTEETDNPVTITVSTTSDSTLTSLKWLAGDKTEDDFAAAGNEIDLATMSFTVGENGTYTIYALNADGLVSLTTITISNITDSDNGTDPGDGTDPREGDDPDESDDSSDDTGSGDENNSGDNPDSSDDSNSDEGTGSRDSTDSGDNPNLSDNTVTGTETDSADNVNSLPATATNLYNLLLIGGVILVLGMGLVVFKRKQNA